MERRFKHRLLSLVLALVMTLTLLPMSAMATGNSTSSELDYRIVHLDSGRKYFSVDNIKSIIDTASDAGFNYLELAFGNDGLRFLLNDMSIEVEQTVTTYDVDEQAADEPVTESEEPAEETPVEEPEAEVPAEEPSEEETAAEEPAEEEPSEEETPAGEPAEEEIPAEEEPAEETSAVPTASSRSTPAAEPVTTTQSVTYTSEKVTAAIQAANEAYYDAGDKNELTQDEMDEIIAYAKENDMEIIPLLNTPGHMDAILDAAEALTGENLAYQYAGDYSDRTIDVTNETAVAFTQALVKKYIDYFAEKGCTIFNIGADEYANDLSYSHGGMGFGQLQQDGEYGAFVTYVNELAAMVKDAGMTPMAFNDGIYYNSDTTYPIGKDILIAYWSSGWIGYEVASASFLAEQGFQMINTHGDYYWVLGKTDAQCSAEKASGFKATAFMGDTISNPAGAMFCIWCDVPGADTADSVVADTAATITAFGKAIAGTTGGGETETEPATVTDTTTNVRVTAPGLTGVTAVQITENVPTIAGAAEVVAYSITPTTADGSYTGSATVAIPVPEEWDLTDKTVKGFVQEEDGTYTLINGTLSEDNSTFTFTCPHFSEAGIVLLSDPITITVTAGGTATETIENVNYSGETAVIEDTSIVTNVTVTGNDAVEGGTTYAEVDVSYDDLIRSDSNGSWRATGYYYRTSDGNYYPLYAQRSRSWRTYYYSWGYSTTDSITNVVECGSDETSWPDWRSPSIDVYQISGTTEPVPASTTVTFTAAADAAGKITTVTLGDQVFTVNVVAEDLSQVDPLTIEYWITNAHVNDANGNQRTAISAQTAYGEDGVVISALVPEDAVKAGDGYETVYWKARRLPDGYHQYTAGDDGVDMCTDEHGTDITHIRYWQGAWWYSADGEEWTRVRSDDQIVAYYMQVSEVTDEVTTVFVDYGVERDEWSGASWLDGKYVRLDFAVRYPSGERVPDSFSTEKTLLYHCDGVGPYRTLKPIRALETAEYEIYLITLTPTSDDDRADFGSDTASTQRYSYDGTETVAWAATQEDLDNSGMEAWTSISGTYSCVIGGSPDLQAIEIYNLQGMRVTYYLRAKVTEDSLTVHYIDRTENYEFYNYNIAVNSGTVFNENIALSDPWKGDLLNGTVINSNNREQTVSSDLSTLTELSYAYADRDYTCVGVTRSEDGKDVYLYYEFEDTHTVVYDYGLPITVPASELALQNATTVTAGTARYGTVTVNADKSVTYTPNTMSPRMDDVELTATFSDTDAGSTTTTYLRVIPATTVYYEDDCGLITYSDGWTTTGNTADSTQTYNTTPYGYDSAYSSFSNYSNGSAHTVNIAEKGDSQTATFTFTGTGFDLYSQTGKTNGLLSIKVVNDSGTMVKNTSVLNTGNETLYQIPVYTVKDLAYDTYTVTVTAFAEYTNTAYPALSQGGYHVIDAVQIYNPLTAEGTQYQTDNEANAVRLKLRNAIIDAETYNSVSDSGNGVLYINAGSVEDNGGVIDYTLVGPNNEAYLNSTGSVIGFILETSSKVATLQIGAKSADGKSVTMSVSVNGESNTASIATATAMNYKLENLGVAGNDGGRYQYTVYISKASGDGILSITDVKATFATPSTAEFKYTKAVAEGATPSEPATTEATIQENGVTVTTNRVRYGRTMTMEVTTSKQLATGQTFTVKAGSRTYTVGGGALNALTVSEGKANSDGTFTYTLQLKPYTYRLIGNTNFVVSLTGADGGTVVSTQTVAVRVTLL